MIPVAILVAASVVIGAAVPALLARAAEIVGILVPFPILVWVTIALAVIAAAFLVPWHRDKWRSFRDEAGNDLAEREAALLARETRLHESSNRLDSLMKAAREQAADLDAMRRDLDARTSALYQAEAAHKADAGDLAERMSLFDMAQAQVTILEARNRLDDERAALRDERAALTGERIALDTARTVHATAVREHARTATVARRGNRKRGAS